MVSCDVGLTQIMGEPWNGGLFSQFAFLQLLALLNLWYNNTLLFRRNRIAERKGIRNLLFSQREFYPTKSYRNLYRHIYTCPTHRKYAQNKIYRNNMENERERNIYIYNMERLLWFWTFFYVSGEALFMITDLNEPDLYARFLAKIYPVNG